MKRKSDVTLTHRVQKFALNTLGRDFVVGDIHGAFGSVLERMQDVDFDTQRDRLFVAGDLVDRGPESKRVMKFLSQPFVHSVLGNHDDAFLQFSIEELRALGQINWNGLAWVNDCDDDEIVKIKKLFSKLPVVIEVTTERGSVGIVHADVPKGMNWAIFTELVNQSDKDTIDTALWGRDRLKNNDHTGVTGIDRLFVGHSIQWDGPKRLGNVYHVDGGAIFREIDGDRGFLTMANLICSSSVIAPQQPRSTAQGAGLYPHAVSGPFGQYVKPEFLNNIS